MDMEIERYIAAAQRHGEDSEPDHEVGDLQDLLRLAWFRLSDAGRRAFMDDIVVKEILERGEES